MVSWASRRDVSRRRFLGETAVAAAALAGGAAVPALTKAADTPITGGANPAMAGFDGLMTGFLERTRAPGAALAVTKAGRLVYARGFGLAEEGRAVEPDSLFRVASVSKPITAVAVLRLVVDGKVRLDEPVLEVVKLRPHFEERKRIDPRWRKVTIRHLLNHTGGWDRDKSGDPIAMPREIARALGKPLPVGPEDVIRVMIARPLDFEPGERYAYSNLGYLLLGRVIEAVGGRPYEKYVQEQVLAPLGVRSARLGRAAIEERLPGEVRYHDVKNRMWPAVRGARVGERVPIQYGGENFDAFEAHGGWVASAVDVVRFAAAFDDPDRCPVLSRAGVEAMWERPAGAAGYEEDGRPKAAYYGGGWMVRPVRDGKANTWHTGRIAGTSALLVRRWDGVNWAVLFNTDAAPDGKALAEAIDPLVHPVVDAVGEWPEVDLFPLYLGSG